MSEQRHETGSAGGPPADDQTREMRAVDVLHGDTRVDAGPAPAGSAPAGGAPEVTGAPAVPVASAVPPPDAADPLDVDGPDVDGPARRGSAQGDPGPGQTGQDDRPPGGSAGADSAGVDSERSLAGASRARLGSDGGQDLTEEAADLAAASRTTASRRTRPPAPPRTRRARLHLRRIDPLSVFLLALLLSLFLAIVIVVAVVALYAVLAAAGVPDTINDLFAEITRASGEAQAQAEPLLTARRAVLAAGVLAAVDVVLLTVLATLGAVLYNVCASFTGGLTVTLAEPEDR